MSSKVKRRILILNKDTTNLFQAVKTIPSVALLYWLYSFRINPNFIFSM